MQSPYTPTEEAILCDYFGMPRSVGLEDIDVFEPVEIGRHVTRSACFEELWIPAAVARIALAHVQHRLPEWGGNRPVWKEHAYSSELLARHLFTVATGDDKEDPCWPVAYHVVRFPKFDRYIVVVSEDSDEFMGIAEYAIGWFLPDRGWQVGSKEVIVRFWNGGTFGWRPQPWETVMEEGDISASTAMAWAGKE